MLQTVETKGLWDNEEDEFQWEDVETTVNENQVTDEEGQESDEGGDGDIEDAEGLESDEASDDSSQMPDDCKFNLPHTTINHNEMER